MTSAPPTPELDEIDLTDRELYRHGFPHEVFTRLREEAPVWRHPETAGTVETDGGGFWVLSRHADVQAVSRDPALFCSLDGNALPETEPERRGTMLITMDPPEHTRLRRLVSAGFTPRMTARLDAQARERAVQIVEPVLERGQCNFVHEIAYQLPLHMIGDIVGIPYDDREPLFDRVTKVLDALDPQSGIPEEQSAVLLMELFMYGRELADEKRRNPVDDVWTTLTTAEVEQPDGSHTQLSEIELDLFFITLVIAGSETTRNAISSGLIALLEHPDQLERLRTDPAVMPTAVEEIVRWSSPVTYFRRTATRDTKIRDIEIEAGDRVTMWYPSANRDAEVFDDPFAFDITRTPNPHVAFGGGGIHYCLGANLAKREIRVMFEELLARVNDIEMTGAPEYSVAGPKSVISNSLKNLPVRLTPR